MSPALVHRHLPERLTAGFRFLPVMISRIMLSLRKAADLEQGNLSLGGSSTNGSGRSWGIVSRGQDDILLDTLHESY